ncbi:hypothetical protein YC2023_115411 [Brassica napus]
MEFTKPLILGRTDLQAHVLILTTMDQNDQNEPGQQSKGHLDQSTSNSELALDRGYIKSHSASLDHPFNPSQFQKCHFLLGSYPTPS